MPPRVSHAVVEIEETQIGNEVVVQPGQVGLSA
jgi:hypothetical protein